MSETVDTSSNYISVAVNAPIKDLLTYSSPTQLQEGTGVIVPLGSRKVSGTVIYNTGVEKGKYKLKNILDVNDERPPLCVKHLKWLLWMSQYYVHPLGQVIESCFPPLKRVAKPRKSKRRSVLPDVEQSTPPKLTTHQSKVYKDILKDIGHFNAHLLHGITGSGKTEVYLHLIDQVLKAGKQALVLVPEISLTPQLVERFSARFPDKICVLHSGLTDRERTEQWWLAHNGEKPILVGARSAIFCPLPDPGIIIVDEEHDSSFKQDEKLKYHGRDSAIMLAKHYHIPIVLGSATPSLESWYNTKTGRFKLHEMPSRVEGRKLPIVEVIDMKDERKARKENTHKEGSESQDLPFWMSTSLYENICETLKKGQQAALFLNRRGMAQTVSCQDCGYVYECPNCAISLTLHHSKHLSCHYCDYGITLKDHCLSCHEPSVTSLGVGTELIEEDIKKLFPEARLARADRDEINSREALEDLIKAVEVGDVDILIGTQMIAKGLDFKKLTLVGLVMADVGFNMPDFRASERSFQLLTQVSGRSGRHTEEPGKVIIQTYNPSHASVEYSVNADFVGFAENELDFRKDFYYPPFGKLSCIRIQGMHLSKVQDCANILKQRADILKGKSDHYETIQVLGPAPAPIERIRNKFRYHLLLKGFEPGILSKYCSQLIGDGKWVPTGTKVLIDVDPMSML